MWEVEALALRDPRTDIQTFANFLSVISSTIPIGSFGGKLTPTYVRNVITVGILKVGRSGRIKKHRLRCSSVALVLLNDPERHIGAKAKIDPVGNHVPSVRRTPCKPPSQRFLFFGLV